MRLAAPPILLKLNDVFQSRESADTLEAESGYTLESIQVTQFRQYILEGLWSKAEAALKYLSIEDPEAVLVSIVQL